MKNSKAIICNIAIITAAIFFIILLPAKLLAYYSIGDIPPRTGIAIDKNGNSCTSYLLNNSLPEGWTYYIPTSIYQIKTPYGTCEVSELDDYSQCCRQLNLDVIDYKTLALNQEPFYYNSEEEPYKCSASIGVTINQATGIAINENDNTCTALLKYSFTKKNQYGTKFASEQPTLEQCLIDYKGWKNYNPENIGQRIVTPYGTADCLDPSFDAQRCCHELGIKFVSNISEAGSKKPLLSNINDKALYWAIPIISLLLVLFITFVVIRRKQTNETNRSR
jgi:hypothetical protein